MQVDYYHQSKEPNIYGNIMWEKSLGQSDSTHPVSSIGANETDHPLEKFRALGYFASCFPEGDGIAIEDLSGCKTPEEVATDIETCFGWSVKMNKK
jgi:hypothetical protein